VVKSSSPPDSCRVTRARADATTTTDPSDTASDTTSTTVEKDAGDPTEEPPNFNTAAGYAGNGTSDQEDGAFGAGEAAEGIEEYGGRNWKEYREGGRRGAPDALLPGLATQRSVSACADLGASSAGTGTDLYCHMRALPKPPMSTR